MPDSEPVHGTPPDKDLRPVRHHRLHAPSRGIPTIPTGHHCLAQPGYSRRLARIENQPPISDSVQPLHRTPTSRQHHHQPETPEPSHSLTPLDRTDPQKPTRSTDQTGNRPPSPELVHGTPPDEGLRLVRRHRPNTQNREIPMISVGYHRLAQPGYGRRLA